jgi:hypothetical protein
MARWTTLIEIAVYILQFMSNLIFYTFQFRNGIDSPANIKVVACSKSMALHFVTVLWRRLSWQGQFC